MTFRGSQRFLNQLCTDMKCTVNDVDSLHHVQSLSGSEAYSELVGLKVTQLGVNIGIWKTAFETIHSNEDKSNLQLITLPPYIMRLLLFDKWISLQRGMSKICN